MKDKNLTIKQLVNKYEKQRKYILFSDDESKIEKLAESNLLIEKKIVTLKPKNIEELLIKVGFVKKILKSFNDKESDILNKLILGVFDDANLLLKDLKE